MPHLADINAAKYTPEVVAALLDGYSDAAKSVILSEADIWRYGDVESAKHTYDETRDWARILTPDQRDFHRWGAWHANNLLKCAAIREVATELGDEWTKPEAV